MTAKLLVWRVEGRHGFDDPMAYFLDLFRKPLGWMAVIIGGAMLLIAALHALPWLLLAMLSVAMLGYGLRQLERAAGIQPTVRIPKPPEAGRGINRFVVFRSHPF